MRARERESKRIERRVTNLLDQRSGKSLDVPSPPLSLSPSIIHPHIIAEQFKLWPTTCNLLRGEIERGRVGGLQRPEDYVTPPVVRISPRHNTTAVASASPPNSAAVCVYCSGVINGTHLAPRVPDGAQRQGRQRRAGGRGRGRRGGKIGRIYQPQNGRKREGGKGFPDCRSVRGGVRLPFFLMIVLEWFVAAGSR